MKERLFFLILLLDELPHRLQVFLGKLLFRLPGFALVCDEVELVKLISVKIGLTEVPVY